MKNKSTIRSGLRGRFFYFLAGLFVLFSTAARVYAADLPDPMADFYVNDYADVLSQDTEDHVIEINDSLYAQTGAQVVVVVRDFLDGMDIEDYGYNLFNQWKIGSDEEDNGVLLLLAIGEDDYRITLGRGAESILSMNFLTAVRDQCLEEPFSAGDYDSAVTQTVDAIAAKMAEYYKASLPSGIHAPEEEPGRVGESSLLEAVIIIILIITVFVGFFSSYTPFGRSRRSWRNMPPPPPPPFHGPGGPRGPKGPGAPGRPGGFMGGFGGPGAFGAHPPRSGRGPGGGHSGGGFSGGGRSGGGHSGGGRSGGGGSSRGGGIGRH